MKKAGLVRSPKRGTVQFTDRGKEVLASRLGRIDVRFLDRFPEFVEFKNLKRDRSAEKTQELQDTPEEVLENAFQNLKRTLANVLLEQIKSSPPGLFEKIVIELPVSMSYGGSLKAAGQAVGKSRDEGMDGIIKEDRLRIRHYLYPSEAAGQNGGATRDSEICRCTPGSESEEGNFHNHI
jgi:restriction system protein